MYVLTDVNVPSAPQFPLSRDVSKSAAYSNTRSMLLESLRNLSTSFESPSSSISSSNEETSTTSINEQYQSLLVMFIGIYQNLTSQRSFGKSIAKNNEEEQEQDFNRLTLRVLISLISSLDIEKDAQSAIQAFNSLPSSSPSGSTTSSSTSTKSVSIESLQISPSRRTLDRIENKWTRIRLALEVLGELVAGIDGLLDPALLGEEEFEEWNGIQQTDRDSEMETEDAQLHRNNHQTNGESTGIHQNGEKQLEQKPLLISKDIRSLLSELPAILLSLGKASSISFTSPSSSSSSSSSSKASNKTASQGETTLISTQIDMPTQTAEDGSTGNENEKEQGTYVPALSEVFSFVHVRALECLNNLLITLARSGISEDGEVKAEKEADEAEEEDIDEASDAELPEDMEEMLNDHTATVDNADAEEGDMEADDDDDASHPVGNGQSNSNYLIDNMPTFQTVFEGLFHTLVDYQARYRNVIQGQLKGNDSRFESLQLVVEASVGCIWALTRLCDNHLVSQLNIDFHQLSQRTAIRTC